MPVFSASATPSPVLSSTLSKSRISQSLDCPTGSGSTMDKMGCGWKPLECLIERPARGNTRWNVRITSRCEM